MMTFEDIRVAHHARSEFVDVPLVADRYADEGRNILANLFPVEQSVVAADDAAGFKLLNPLHHRRRGQVNFIGYVRQAPPTVILQNKKYF